MAAARTTAKADREREDLKGVSNRCNCKTLSLDQKCFFSPGNTWTGSFPVSVLVVASGEGGEFVPAVLLRPLLDR